MRALWGWIIAIVVIVAIVIGIVAATGNNNKNNNQNTTPPPASTSTTPPPASSSNQKATSTNKVTMENMSFSPDSITVKKGTTVTWTNNDNTAHTVTSDSEHGPKSDIINPGQSYTFTFSDEGTFDYHCSIHTFMTGKVIVTD